MIQCSQVHDGNAGPHSVATVVDKVPVVLAARRYYYHTTCCPSLLSTEGFLSVAANDVETFSQVFQPEEQTTVDGCVTAQWEACQTRQTNLVAFSATVLK